MGLYLGNTEIMGVATGDAAVGIHGVNQEVFDAHVNDKENPHGVTAAQTGAPTKEEMEAAIAAIPTPDVSGQINAHNTDDAAHADIRAMAAEAHTNILHNWYFVDPIDQRGGYVVPPGTTYYVYGTSEVAGTTTTYVKVDHFDINGYPQIVVDGTSYGCAKSAAIRGYTNAGYTIDRWRLIGDSAAVVFDGGFATLHGNSSGAYWLQYIENKELYAGKMCTFSALYGGNVFHTVSGVLIEGSDLVLDGAPGGRDVVTLNSNNLYVQHTANAGHAKSVVAAKLELGSVQTLAHQDANGNWVLNDPPPDKGMELLKCIQSTADASDTYANKVIATGYTCNKNLLDNWYFANPADNRSGHVVPPNRGYYAINDWSATVGTTDKYYPVKRWLQGANLDGVVEINGVEYVVAGDNLVRGYTGTGYTIDRWRTGGKTTVCLLAPCVVLRLHEQASSAFTYGWWQVLECADLVGKDVTLSALTDGSADFGVRMRFVNDSNAFVSAKVLEGLSAGVNAISTVVPDGAAKVWVQFSNVANNAANASLNIYAAKLELGTQQTLAHQENGVWVLNDIPNKSEESLKCCMSTADPSDTYANQTIGAKPFHFGTSAPSNTGTLWIDTNATTGGLKYYNGSAWVHVPVAYT